MILSFHIETISSIQHGDGIITFMLNHEFNGTVDGVEMLGEVVNHITLHDHHCVIDISSPVSWRRMERGCSSKCSIYKFATTGLTGKPIAAPSIEGKLPIVREIRCF